LALFISSCKKDKKENDSDTTAATDHTYAENVSNDVTNIGDQAGGTTSAGLATYKNGDNSTFSLSCAQTITRDTINKVVTVDFGTANNICADGRTRKGKIIYSYSGGNHYCDSGVVITVAFSNYYVDNNQVTGTKTITNKGRIAGNFNWNVNANIVISKGGNGNISWSCNHTKVLLNTSTVYFGPSTPIDWAHAKIGLTGTANGTTVQGDNFTANITNQLIRDCNCAPDPAHIHRHPFIQGTIQFTPGTKPTRTIDFGSGTCDFDATVTINGNTYNITLH
jgi:hypothetical protein